MVHPDQLVGFFQMANDQIRQSGSWNWPELSFEKPYRTSWTDVQARGPFNIQFSTEHLAGQEIGFELNWSDPTITIGQFQIDDTITRNVGGATIVIHLSGQCNGMTLTIPSGQWNVKGRLGWDWNGSEVKVHWIDFAFSMNQAAIAQANLGQCQGPQGLQSALLEAINSISKDQSWLQDVLRDGVMDWVEGSLGTLREELLKPRAVSLKPGLEATWQPEGVAGAEGGRVRVNGRIELAKNSRANSETVVERSYSESSLNEVSDSGFVLPTDTLQAIVNFLYQTGDLQYRIESNKIESFQSFMQSRFLQFFVWPDLMSFAKSTLFYFDVTTSAPPQLRSAVTLEGQSGVSYSLQAPLLVHQWAPSRSAYLPYVDFRSTMNGKLDARVKDQKLVLQMTPNDLEISKSFRPEFAKVRSVNSYIATSLLGSRVKNYLGSQPVSIDLPKWQLGEKISLTISDVQAWKQSFRVPLQFKNSK